MIYLLSRIHLIFETSNFAELMSGERIKGLVIRNSVYESLMYYFTFKKEIICFTRFLGRYRNRGWVERLLYWEVDCDCHLPSLSDWVSRTCGRGGDLTCLTSLRCCTCLTVLALASEVLHPALCSGWWSWPSSSHLLFWLSNPHHRESNDLRFLSSIRGQGPLS